MEAAPDDAAAIGDYAVFLDHRGDPGCRDLYRKQAAALKSSSDKQQITNVYKRLIVLDLTQGDRAAAVKDDEAYRAATGGAELLPSSVRNPGQMGANASTISIPGPIRSFSRMAAISGEARPEEILPALARNVVTNGYQASHSNDALEQTEYLKLVHRYLSQVHELEKLAGTDLVLKIDNCESPKAGELLRILGFRMRGGCGSEVVLETVNATRAFLTTDSGFPLADLEQALRAGRPFTYDFHPTQVPVLYGADFWMSGKEKENSFIEMFLADPQICRLYLGLSKMDPQTADEIRKVASMPRLKAYAHVLDFFGGMFIVRDGKALVPGHAAAWSELVGVAPDKGAAFFDRLIAKDDGWLASLYDALARLNGPVRDYLTEPARMRRFYLAVHGRVTSPGPARPVFRSNADMMLLTTRLRVDATGKPIIPGSLDVWKNLFVNHPQGKYDAKLTRAAGQWKDPDDVLEALFGLTRKAVENEPLKIFMAMTDLDRNRTKPLQAATVDKLARSYRQFGAQYAIFNDSPSLSDAAILKFVETAELINKVKDPLLKSDAAGSMQSLVGMWQIFCRQGTIPEAKQDETFSALLKPFAEIKSERDVFDGGRSGVKLLLAATGSKLDDQPQERIVELLAGTAETSDVETRTAVVQEMVRILEAQRIISLDTLFQLADHLDAVAKGGKVNAALLARLAARVSEINLPRAALSGVEKNAIAFGYWTEKHIENERKINLRAVIERPGADPEKLRDARGLLAPFLRDTLVAYNYIHYAPPGAQILYTNPLFVRGHDFLGIQGTNHTWKNTELYSSGWPSNAGGRLLGSLAGLPYALAEAEQNFLVPQQTQALIWGDLVPQIILSAKIPRWWNVTPAQMHWAALHLRYAHSLVAEAVLDPALRKDVLDALSVQAAPVRIATVASLLEHGDARAAIDRLTPSELFVLASRMITVKKQDSGPCLAELQQLAADVPNEVNYRAISRAFGTPKPTLANSYQPELLHLRTFPTLMGYSSRILAESWESNGLYWAELADELHLRPTELNVRVPEWTQKLVERIFASHLEDWPAMLRSLRLVGDDIRTATRKQMIDQKASLQD